MFSFGFIAHVGAAASDLGCLVAYSGQGVGLAIDRTQVQLLPETGAGSPLTVYDRKPNFRLITFLYRYLPDRV